MATVGVVACVGMVGAARADTLVSFRTPSGNIGCVYLSGPAQPNLRCDIRSGLQPRPSKPPGCLHLNWGDSYEMNSTGRVGLTCHGDTAILPNSRVLRYGSVLKLRGFVCRSRAVGLRCRNLTGHGFFLSRRHSYRF
ncbi:MAG TPA: DUF6636 domain-containing protein [Gaiellaceae bacterium]|nr:DUF6636 domain-containing protein [Gaiellaceae bacterium]